MFEKIKSLFFQESKNPAPKKELHTSSLGASGTSYFSGLFNEEYLPTLQGQQAAMKFDEMRRSDARIKMLLSAVIDPIVSCHWHVKPAEGDNPDYEKHAEFVEFALLKDSGQSFKQHCREAMGLIVFGHAVFELIHKVSESPKWGKYIGYSRIAWRSQKSIYKWFVNGKTGQLDAVQQTITGDFVLDVQASIIDIPGQYLLVMTNQKEGDNFEGISELRPVYGNWFRKNLFLKLTGIGVERNAIGTVVGTVPKSEISTAQADDFKQILEDYISHESGYMMISEGWTVDIKTNSFDPDKIVSVIRFENEEMTQAFLANFLNLGQGGNSGAYALSNDLSDFFFNAIKSKADIFKDAHNAKTVKELVDFNFGPQDAYPCLEYSGLDDKAGKELSEIVKNYIDAGAIIPDSELEEFLRKINKLPEKMETPDAQVTSPTQDATLAQSSTQPAPAQDTSAKTCPDCGQTLDAQGKCANGNCPMHGQMPMSATGMGQQDQANMSQDQMPDMTDMQYSERLKLAETPWQFIGAQTDIVKNFVQVRVRMIGERLINDVIKKYKALPENSKRDAIKNNSVGFLTQYKKDLRNLLAQIATDAIAAAKKEVPGGSKIQFAEDYFTNLNKLVKAMVQATADLIVNAQGGDIEKTIYAQYNSSVDSTNDYAILEQDMKDALQKYNDGPSVQASAGNSVAIVTNTARDLFFENPQVADKIESFTFKNPRPETIVCKELTGKTFSIDDKESMRYAPPLHHNCKSYLSPNYKGENNPQITGLNPSAAAKKVITLEQVSIEGILTMADTGSLVMQTLILKKETFSSSAAASKWITDHNFHAAKIDETTDSYRFRQREPGDFKEGSFVSKVLTNGVTAVFGRLK